MKQQNDWYTGIDHYHNALEREIQVETKQITGPTRSYLHERVELLYVRKGEGRMIVNGCAYPMEAGALFCLYSHHFHHVAEVLKPLDIVVIRFYIGLFMYMSWEKHPRNANARLMYDTVPVVMLKGKEADRIEELVRELADEEKGDRFQRMNMMQYKTLELHAYYCRYAYEAIGALQKERDPVWDVILKVVLGTREDIPLSDMAEDCGLPPAALNRRIKEVSGFTYCQIKQYGKIINACALLHFSELSMEYIGGLLNYPSVPSFYRVFKQFLHMTPREYQERFIYGGSTGGEPGLSGGQNVALQFLQYICLNLYEDITLGKLCGAFVVKEYTAKKIMKDCFGKSFEELLADIRVRHSCALLAATDKSVLEIATDCGFESLVTFERHFQRCMFQTPGQYRHWVPHEK